LRSLAKKPYGSFRSPEHGQHLCAKLDIMCQRIVLGGQSGVRRPGNAASTRAALGIRPALRLLGLFGCRSYERFIPDVYLHADVRQRTFLLLGLLDSDGSIGKSGTVMFEVTSKQLADDTAELVRSLGGVVRRGERQGKYAGKVCPRCYHA